MITHIDAQLLKRPCFVELFETNKIHKSSFVIQNRKSLKTEYIMRRRGGSIFNFVLFYLFATLENQPSMWILSENDTTHTREVHFMRRTIAQKAIWFMELLKTNKIRQISFFNKKNHNVENLLKRN